MKRCRDDDDFAMYDGYCTGDDDDNDCGDSSDIMMVEGIFISTVLPV